MSHPEAVCGMCLGANPVWTAPAPLWNEVMRDGDINGRELYDGIVCPSCFAKLATEAGIAGGWRLTATDVHVELLEITPSGRSWNDKTWLWEEQNTASEPKKHDPERH